MSYSTVRRSIVSGDINFAEAEKLSPNEDWVDLVRLAIKYHVQTDQFRRFWPISYRFIPEYNRRELHHYAMTHMCAPMARIIQGGG